MFKICCIVFLDYDIIKEILFKRGDTMDNNLYNQPSCSLEEPISVKDWLIMFLILLIPIANIVMVFVWAFSKEEKKSKSNFFKAYLIYAGICIVISLILWAIIFAIVMNYFYFSR